MRGKTHTVVKWSLPWKLAELPMLLHMPISKIFKICGNYREGSMGANLVMPIQFSWSRQLRVRCRKTMIKDWNKVVKAKTETAIRTSTMLEIIRSPKIMTGVLSCKFSSRYCSIIICQNENGLTKFNDYTRGIKPQT